MSAAAKRLGATPQPGGGCEFVVWAPRAQAVEIHLTAPQEKSIAMQSIGRGYHCAFAGDVSAGAQYRYRLDGKLERPDPASRFQPEGPHGPSQVVAQRWSGWQDAAWRGLPLRDYVLYELHTGTFTPQGTFDAIIPRLDELQQLGITAIELMPIAQFPGARNWGYDGTFLFAPQNSYGGPEGLKRLVNACHERGMAVALDVVYNHLGPEGNYLHDFAPYFSQRYRTPWGEAINFDGAESDDVRRFFVENALEWVTDYHIDALRLDAIHAILDLSAYPFLTELGQALHRRGAELQREILVIPESDRNDARFVERLERGGCGLDAQWNDDFHHALHVLLTGESAGYYEDFAPVAQAIQPVRFGPSQDAQSVHSLPPSQPQSTQPRQPVPLTALARAMQEGYVFQGEYSAYRRRRHGNSSQAIPAERLVVFAQNHDQIGNRMLGERLSTLVDFESLKLAAGVLLLSPFVPLLFMGEEYGDPAPFQYFVSHSDAALIEGVRKGRREEFARFRWQGDLPDPQDEATFARCRLNWDLRRSGHHAALRELHRELLRLRREAPALRRLDKQAVSAQVFEQPRALAIRRTAGGDEVFAVFHFGAASATLTLPRVEHARNKLLDSADPRWGGPGSALPAVLNSNEDVILEFRPRTFALFR